MKSIQLQIKLEDWITEQCKVSGISVQDVGLPNTKMNHRVINQRTGNFESLVDNLLTKNNIGVQHLKRWLR